MGEDNGIINNGIEQLFYTIMGDNNENPVNPINIIFFVIFFILFLILCIVIYYQFRYPFWNRLPIFHSYDFWRYWISSPCLILEEKQLSHKPNKQLAKYYNPTIQTKRFLDLEEGEKRAVLTLIKTYYLTTETSFLTMEPRDFSTIITGQTMSSIVSLFYESGDTTGDITACLTSHSYIIFINSFQRKQKETVYYLDYLSVKSPLISQNNKTHLNQKRILTQQCIYTHLFNQTQISPTVLINIFKKEGTPIAGIVPFFSTFSYSFLLHKEMNIRFSLSVATSLNGLTNEGLNDFVEKIENIPFHLSIYGENPWISGMVKQQIFLPYVLKIRDIPVAYYFFKNEKTEVEIPENQISVIYSLMSSVFYGNPTEYSLFYQGFLGALREIIKSLKKGLSLTIKIEDSSHNGILLQQWIKTIQNSHSFTKIPVSYYFYNFIYPHRTLSNEQVFLLI